jgi:predicted dehydrogenase
MDKVRLGVVGVGWAAQVIHLPILMKHPESQVVAICDKDKAKVRLVGEKFGIARQYTDVDEMLAENSLDAILVCTSTDAHRDVAVAALRAGKDVFVEKPIARRYQEALDMVSAAKESRRKLMVGMNHRFRPDTMILKSFIEGKELGKIFYTRVGWLRRHNLDRAWLTQKEKSGGGAFIDLGIVMLDMALWMMGYPEVVRLGANHYQHRTKQVEDTSVVHITLKSGAVVNIEVSWSMCLKDDLYYCYVHGSEGSASLSPLTINKELHGNLVNLAPAKLDSPQQLFKRSYENELKHFLGAVKDIHPVVSTGDEAVQRMRIVDAVYRSAKRGKEVTLGKLQ